MNNNPFVKSNHLRKKAMRFLKIYLFSLFLIGGLCGSVESKASEINELINLPIQDGGRVKPYGIFAIETLEMIHGKSKFEGRPASEIVLTWLLQPEAWQSKELIEIRYSELKTKLGFPETRKHFSLKEIFDSEHLSEVFAELASKRESKEKLNPYFQSVQRLENQIFLFKEIVSGQLLRFLPPKSVELGQTVHWRGLPEFDENEQAAFQEIIKNFISYLGAQVVSAGDANPGAKSDIQEKISLVVGSVSKFKQLGLSVNSELYDQKGKLDVEIHLSRFHPFKWSWVSYLLAAIIGFLSWILARPNLYRVSWFFGGLGLFLNIYGFALRVYIMGRPPVSNMYETVVWVGFGAVLFAMIIEYFYRWRFVLAAGMLVGAGCLALADAAPAVLDGSLQPLEPVLRSNFWLLVHVMTITISYAAFFLAFALGDLGLFYFLKEQTPKDEKVKAIVLAIYRAIQIGVAFLAPGIILGGVWADYSWGRFWGWDPKETWALIALLGYLAVLHAKIGGMIKDFGMIVTAVVSFSLVIMAWYGVNFVLGAGLHSYGFGAGGVEYVAGFIGLHFVLVFFAILKNKRLKKSSAN